MADEVILSSIGSESAPILIKLTTWRGMRFLDIRKYFTQDGDLTPTRKGISLRVNGVVGVKEGLDKYSDDVLDFLKGSESTTSLSVASRSDEESKLVEALTYGPRRVEVRVSGSHNGAMFRRVSSGDRDTIILDGEHPFLSDKLQQNGNLAEALSQVFNAYLRAKELLVNDPDEARLLAELEYSWSRILEGAAGVYD